MAAVAVPTGMQPNSNQRFPLFAATHSVSGNLRVFDLNMVVATRNLSIKKDKLTSCHRVADGKMGYVSVFVLIEAPRCFLT